MWECMHACCVHGEEIILAEFHYLIFEMISMIISQVISAVVIAID